MDEGTELVVVNNAGTVVEAIDAALVRALEEVGLLAEGYAKRELSTPKGGHKTDPDPRPSVDTGVLRNSVTHAVDARGKYVVVGTNVEYAPHVELGTVRAKAFPFLRPAAVNHTDEYREAIRSGLRDG